MRDAVDGGPPQRLGIGEKLDQRDVPLQLVGGQPSHHGAQNDVLETFLCATRSTGTTSAEPAAALETAGPVGTPKSSVSGLLKVIEGKAEKSEYPLTTSLTYIGKSETAAIKIKGFFAPDIAVLISKRPAGFLLTAVKDNYPKINNSPISGQVELKDNDILEVGGIKFLFQVKPA